jgi:hypothetical protein
MAFIQRFLAAVFLAALAACVPHFTSYVHLRAPEGTFVPATCGNSGPPVFARNVTITIADTAGYMGLDNGDPPIRFRLKLAATTNQGGIVEQRFDFEGLPAKIDFGGTLHLPDVIVDGKTVVAPVFEFYRQRYAGAAPANC